MARKRARKRVVHSRKRRAVVRRHRVNAPKRRRRRAVAVTHYAANPRRRRRRHAVARTKRRARRSYRRNPSFGINFLVEGLKDGAGVVVGQVGARKIGALAKQYVPGMSATTGVMSVLPTLAGAIATAFVARKALPRYSRVITAGAFAEAITQGLAQTPAAPFLAAWPAGGARVGTVSAWPAQRALPANQPAPGMKAWPARRVGIVREVGG